MITLLDNIIAKSSKATERNEMNYWRLSFMENTLKSLQGPMSKRESQELNVIGLKIWGERISTFSVKANSREEALLASKRIEIRYD